MSVDQLLHEHRAPIVKFLDAAVALAAVATIPVTVLQIRDEQDAWVLAADWVIWTVFVVEYVVMFHLPPDQGGFNGRDERDWQNFGDWRNWVSIGIVVLSFPLLPALLGMVRLVRVVRLARLGRIAAVSTRGIGRTLGRRGVVYVFGFVILAIVVGGVAITAVEPAVTQGESLADGIWWATSTTVGTGIGVGDPAPASTTGRAIALGLTLCGVAFVTTLAGSIAAYFLGEDEAKWADMNRRLDEIHASIGATSAASPPDPQPPEGADDARDR